MQRKIVKTADGSTTIQISEWEEQYHSMHGAIQEAQHVFLKMGLDFFRSENPSAKSISILEIGFGTGLNAILTCLKAKKINLNFDYTGVEAYPVKQEELDQLNYVNLIGIDTAEGIFSKMHQTPWEEKHGITSNFNLTKRKQTFQTIIDSEEFHLIYFDAFGARVQPELWEESIFTRMYEALKPGGILVTYSAKGSVRRAMQSVGFNVERLPGPPGKREMLRAVK